MRESFQKNIADYLVEDNLLYAKPFGSLEDPLLAKALEEITGVSPLVKKSTGPESHFISMPRPRKPLEERRVELPEIL